MIITLCRRGLLKVYASFCELNISFYKTLTFRFADYIRLECLKFFVILNEVSVFFAIFAERDRNFIFINYSG